MPRVHARGSRVGRARAHSPVALDSHLLLTVYELLARICVVLLTILVLLKRLSGLSLLAKSAGPVVFGLIWATGPESAWWFGIGRFKWPKGVTWPWWYFAVSCSNTFISLV